jgi:hypothetical protein
MRETEQYCY